MAISMFNFLLTFFCVRSEVYVGWDRCITRRFGCARVDARVDVYDINESKVALLLLSPFFAIRALHHTSFQLVCKIHRMPFFVLVCSRFVT